VLFQKHVGFIEALLCFVRRNASDFVVQAFCVVPVHPFQGFPFYLSGGFSRSHEVDDLGFEQADCTFGQGIVAAVANASNGRVDVCFSKPFVVANGQILPTAVRMVH